MAQRCRTRPDATARPRRFAAWRGPLLAMLAAALAWPSLPAASVDRQFVAGSLIIPMSLEYQPSGGVVSAYGLVYAMLARNTDASRIKIYWAVQPKKLSQYHCNTGSVTLPAYGADNYNDDDGCDLYVQSLSSGKPVKLVASATSAGVPSFTEPFDFTCVGYSAAGQGNTAPGPFVPGTSQPWCPNTGRVSMDASRTRAKYLGGVWVVEAGADTTEFLRRLYDDSYPELAKYRMGGEKPVRIHWTNAEFTAPVVSELAQKPPRLAIVAGNNGQADKIRSVLSNAGVCPGLTNCSYDVPTSNPPATWTPGVVYDWYQDVRQLLDTTAGFPNGRLNATLADGSPLYGVVWLSNDAMDQISSLDSTNGRLANLNRFVQDRLHTLFVGYDSIQKVEAGALFQTATGGLNMESSNSAVPQAEDCTDGDSGTTKWHSNSTSLCLIYGGANQPYAQTGNAPYENGMGSVEGYRLSSGNAWKSGVTQVLQIKSTTNSGNGNGGGTVVSVATAIQPANKALIVYLAGFRYDNAATIWGERLILNTLYAGLNPPQSEFARSEPVGYKLTSGASTTKLVFQGTFFPKARPADNDIVTYNSAHPEKWEYPFTQGRLYAYDLTRLSTSATGQGFSAGSNSSAVSWEASVGLANLSPGARVVFTFSGSSPGSAAPYLGSANLGWKKVYFLKDGKGNAHDESSTSCTDANGDGWCDLSQMLAATNTGLNGTIPRLSKSSPDAAVATRLKLFLRQVLGYCAAHDGSGNILWDNTDASRCDNPWDPIFGTGQTNQPALGGIDHGSPAIVGPSQYVTDAPYDGRPVVAYAGGTDGMLHAFYVGGATTWSAQGYSLPTGVTAGRELWAMVPPGQVGDLGFNKALVDGSINVVDVFGDFPYDTNGDGVIDWGSGAYDATTNPDGEAPNHRRRWRTVLLATVGQQQQSAWARGSEVFALDVTNPLNPVLLWRVGGVTEHDGRFDVNGNGAFGVGSGNALAETFAATDPGTFALKWNETDTTNYLTPSADAVAAMKCGKYDYSNLGSAYSTAVAKVWNGGAFQYVAFVATNAAQFSPSGNSTACGTSTVTRGAEVFAIDVITGRKLWQWERDYAAADATAVGVDNTVPPRLALGDIDVNGSTDRVYLGDMAGHVWELYVRDGRNVNYLPDKNRNWHSFPLFGTAPLGASGDSSKDQMYYVNGRTPLSQQPLTTPIGQGRFTQVPAEPASLARYIPYRLSLVVGTMGVAWNIAEYQHGHIFVVPISPETGLKLTQAELDPNDPDTDPRRKGVLRQGAAWDIELAVNERVYGMPRVVNNMILFNTAYGASFATDDIASTASNPGRLWTQSATGSVSATSNDAKSFGGVVVFEGAVVITTDTSIHKMASPPAAVTGQAARATLPFNRGTPAVMKKWEKTQ